MDFHTPLTLTLRTTRTRLFAILGWIPAELCLKTVKFRSNISRCAFAPVNTRLLEGWRRERDSNPRYPFGYIGFQDRLFQPLTHPSAAVKSLSIRMAFGALKDTERSETTMKPL